MAPGRAAGLHTGVPGAQALYLSKNPLTSLAGVAQFGALRCLGAGDCGLAGLDALAPLAPLAATLQAAAFEGCPLAALPHYRAHARLQHPRVLSRFPLNTVFAQRCAAQSTAPGG
jgi:hypothetical protein